MSAYPAFVSNDVIPVTPTDNLELQNGIIECTGTGGTVSVVTTAGNPRSYTITVGGQLKATVKIVNATGTTATGLVLYPM